MKLFGTILTTLLVSLTLPLCAEDPSCKGNSKQEAQKLRAMSNADLARIQASAEAGDPDAQYAWANTFGFGIGKPRDLVAAHQWLVKSAEGGNCPAQLILSQGGATVSDRPADMQEIYRWNLKLAERGLWTSQINVGSMLTNGIGVEKDEKKGFEWFLRAADENGAANGQLAVASAYMDGVGVAQDLDKAESYARRAAEQGLTMAETLIASIQKRRTGLLATNFEAEKKLADEGNAPMQYSVGRAYRIGEHIPRDYDKALQYLRLSAAQGYPVAPFVIAEMYEHGEGVQQSFEQALNHYSLAANLGLRKAQSRLGSMYQQGLGTAADPVAAYSWICIAARRGDPESKTKKLELESHLTLEQRTAGEKLTKAFFVENPDQDVDLGPGPGQAIQWVVKTDIPDKKD